MFYLPFLLPFFICYRFTILVFHLFLGLAVLFPVTSLWWHTGPACVHGELSLLPLQPASPGSSVCACRPVPIHFDLQPRNQEAKIRSNIFYLVWHLHLEHAVNLVHRPQIRRYPSRFMSPSVVEETTSYDQVACRT